MMNAPANEDAHCAIRYWLIRANTVGQWRMPALASVVGRDLPIMILLAMVVALVSRWKLAAPHLVFQGTLRADLRALAFAMRMHDFQRINGRKRRITSIVLD